MTDFEAKVFKTVVWINCIEILIEAIAITFVTTKLIKRGQFSLLPFYVKIFVGLYILFVLF